MASSKKSTEVLSINHQDNGEWLETTPGERFTIRTSAKETKGIYTMLEVVADPRNGVPIHIHKNEDEHFLVLEGTLHIVIGDVTLDVRAGIPSCTTRSRQKLRKSIASSIVSSVMNLSLTTPTKLLTTRFRALRHILS